MRRRGFLGAMLGIPAIPVAAKAISELEKFDTLPTNQKISQSVATTDYYRSGACTVTCLPGAISSWPNDYD